MPKWEYCAVVGLYSGGSRERKLAWPAIWYFTAQGVRVVQIRGDEVHELAVAIARLGDESWELAGVSGPEVNQGDVLYFKRVVQ